MNVLVDHFLCAHPTLCCVVAAVLATAIHGNHVPSPRQTGAKQPCQHALKDLLHTHLAKQTTRGPLAAPALVCVSTTCTEWTVHPKPLARCASWQRELSLTPRRGRVPCDPSAWCNLFVRASVCPKGPYCFLVFWYSLLRSLLLPCTSTWYHMYSYRYRYQSMRVRAHYMRKILLYLVSIPKELCDTQCTGSILHVHVLEFYYKFIS